MIFAIPSNAQAPSFNSRETKSDGLAQSRSVNVWDAVLVADPSIRKIESLPWHVSIRIWGIVCCEPTSGRSKLINNKQ